MSMGFGAWSTDWAHDMILMCQCQVKNARSNKEIALFFLIMFPKCVHICPGDCFVIYLLLESILYSRPMLGAGSSSWVNPSGIHVCRGVTGWDRLAGAALPIHPHIRTLSTLVKSPFLHKDFASSSPYSGMVYVWPGVPCLTRTWR